jgi:hypothetical protein
VQNKIGQFARDLGFERVLVWTRESDPSTGQAHVEACGGVSVGR